MVVFAEGTGGYVLVTDFRGMALNGLFCADVLRPLHLVPLTDFVYIYRPDCCTQQTRIGAGEKFTNNDFFVQVHHAVPIA